MSDAHVEVVVQAPPVVEIVTQAPPVVHIEVISGGGSGGASLSAGPGLTIVAGEIRHDIESLTRG